MAKQEIPEDVQEKNDAEVRRDMQAWWETHGPGTMAAASSGGATLDSSVNAVNARVDAVVSDVKALTARVEDLEEGGGTDPNPPDPPEPPNPPTDKRYPDENDPMTGVPAGTQLTNSGSVTISSGVLENKNINGTVSVTGKGVKIRNCRITSGGYNIVTSRQDASFELDHCEIIGNGSGQNGFDGTGWVHHCRISKCENPINIAGNGAKIEWNDIHDMKGTSSSHIDGVQADGSIDGLTIRNNRLDNKNGDTSAVMLDNYWGPIKNVTVENNFLGGGSYPAYLDASFKGSANAQNIVYKNNVMRTGGWGGYFYWREPGSGCSKTGNVDYQTGANVDNK